jgi:uncharacterized protein (DUF2147 family)
MKALLATLILSLSMSLAFGQSSVIGKWKTIDDETGEMKSVVETYMKDGKLYGKIIKLAPGRDQNAKCTACKEELNGKKIVGMEIIMGLKKDGSEWYLDDGILDPESGKFYDCKIWTEGNKLQVRGYIGWVFRTQTWIKA